MSGAVPVTHCPLPGFRDSSPRPALILYTRNHGHTLPVVLEVVRPAAERLGCPLLAVDDASEDGTRALLEQRGVPFVTQPARSGAAAAWNRGAAAFPDRDLLCLRGDTVPETPDWAERLVNAAAALPGTGVLGVRLVTPDGRILSEGRRIVTGLGLTWSEADRRRLQADGPAPSEPVDTDAVAGDLFWCRRAALDAAGGFDPAYVPDALETDDFCFAVRVHGFDVRVLPDVRALSLRPAPLPEGAMGEDAARTAADALKRIQARYWNAKWGWDPFLPDLGEVRRLYGATPAGRGVDEALRLPPFEAFPDVDLCMVTWNGAARIARCLESLGRTDYPADRLRLYLVDNASTDETPELLPELTRTLPFACRLIRLDVNTGGVVGLNWAFAQGTAPFLAKLDDDVVLPPHWLRRLLDVFRKRPYAGVVGPRIVDDTPARLIQCADHSYHPVPGCHEQEPDDNGTAYLARVTHVRGCCNLYRRDVLDRCGPLDIRFSPSQWDDPDHHMALLTAGYEVVYDGTTVAAHKCTTGTAGGASLAHAAINKAKMLLKWGQDSPQVLEYALLLSREGRFLPESGDTRALLERGPDPALFPRTPAPELIRQVREEGLGIAADDPAAPQRTAARVHTARRLLRDAADARLRGDAGAAGTALRAAVSTAPHDPPALAALADLLDDAGLPSETLRRRAALLERAQHAPPPVLTDVPGRRLPPLPRPTDFERFPAGSVCGRVLFCLPHARRLDPDLADLLRCEADALAGQGFAVRASARPAPLPGVWDIVHFWTLDAPHETLLQMKAARGAVPGAALVLSPLLRNPDGPRLAARLFEALRNPATPFPPEGLAPEPHDGDPERRLLCALAAAEADALVLTGPEEAALLEVSGTCSGLVFSDPPPLPAAADAGRADPEAFCRACGLREFMLCLAPFHPLSNQAVLIAAVGDTAVPLVLAGRVEDRGWFEACRRQAPRNVIFIEDMDEVMTASALAAARAHVLPHLGVPGLVAERAALSAALVGTPAVAPAGGLEARLLHRPGANLFHACNPLSVPSVRGAVCAALQAVPNTDAVARLRLRSAPARRTARLVGLYRRLIAAGCERGRRSGTGCGVAIPKFKESSWT